MYFRFLLISAALSGCVATVAYDPYPAHGHCQRGDRRCHAPHPVPPPGHAMHPPAHVQVWHQPGRPHGAGGPPQSGPHRPRPPAQWQDQRGRSQPHVTASTPRGQGWGGPPRPGF